MRTDLRVRSVRRHHNRWRRKSVTPKNAAPWVPMEAAILAPAELPHREVIAGSDAKHLCIFEDIRKSSAPGHAIAKGAPALPSLSSTVILPERMVGEARHRMRNYADPEPWFVFH